MTKEAFAVVFYRIGGTPRAVLRPARARERERELPEPVSPRGGRPLRQEPYLTCFLKVLAGKSCRKKSCRQKWSSRLGSGALAPARRLLGMG